MSRLQKDSLCKLSTKLERREKRQEKNRLWKKQLSFRLWLYRLRLRLKRWFGQTPWSLHLLPSLGLLSIVYSLDLVRTRGLRLHHRPYSTDPVSSELTPRIFTTLDQNVVEGGHYRRSDPFFGGGGRGQSRDRIRYLTYFGLWVWDTIIHQSAMTRIAANQIVMHCILLNDFLVD